MTEPVTEATAFDVVGAPPVPWVRERDVDLMLAESLSTSIEFVEWMMGQVPAMERASEIISCAAVVNFNRPDAVAAGTGETDVLAEVTWSDGVKGLLSIEDKVLASPQLNQGRRHKAYLDAHPCELTASGLVAPSAWIARYPREVAEYDCSVLIEAVAEWHEAQNDPALAWRAQVFRQASQQRSVFEVAADLDEWCADLNEQIRSYGLALAPQARTRTAAAGQAKPDRFIWCAEDTLGEFEDLEAVMFFKTATANHRGRVAIHVTIDDGDELKDWLWRSAEEAGFTSRTTERRLMVESSPDAAAGFTIAQPISEQSEAVDALAEDAKKLQGWWNSLAKVEGRPWQCGS